MTFPDDRQASHKTINPAENATYRRMVSQFPATCIVAGLADGSAVAWWIGADAARIFGYDVSELEDDPDLWINIVHPDDRERVLDAYRRLAEGAHVREEYRIYRKDGQMRWIGETIASAEATTETLVQSIRCITDITAAKSIAQRGIAFKALVDETPAGVTVRDLTGRMIYCNKACAVLYGFDTPQQMIGTTFEDVMDPEFVEQFRQHMFPLILQGPWSSDVRLVRRDGTAVDVKATTSLFRDDEGHPVAVYSILMDISQLKQVEGTLRTKEEFLRRRYDAISAGMIVTDSQGRIAYANNAAGDILGLSPEQMLATTAHDSIWQFVREDGSPLPLDEFPPYVAIRTGKPVRGEVVGVVSGEPPSHHWIVLNCEPILDPATGKVTEIIDTFVDITERKQAEQALAESEERYRSLVDTADAVIFRIDPQGRPIALYGCVAERTGYSIAEFMENPLLWRARIHPDDLERVGASYQEIASTGEPKAIEMRIVQRSGAILWVRTHNTPRYDGEGNLLYFDAVGLDISERVEAQQREARRAAGMVALADVSQAFASSLDAQHILDSATQRLCNALGSVSLGITFEPSNGRLLHLSTCCPRGRDTENLDRAIERTSTTIDDVFGPEGAKPRLVTDMRSVSRVGARFVDAAGLGPGIVAPVTAGEGAIGILAGARPHGQEFDHEDLWFLTEIASHASAALASADLYKRQAHIAETLQRSLMPGKPVIECLDVATLYSPAPGEIEVGGDFLDIFPLDNDRVGLVVGDVSGKGLEAAIHTAEAKYMLRAFVHQNSDPSYVMSSLNQALYSFLPDETFITLTYFVIDAHQHTISYVNAGHEISLVLCRDYNALKEIRPSGPVLGVMTNAIYDIGYVPLEPDDTLVSYTDGVTDVRIDGDRFGYDRLRDAVAVAPPGDAQSLMDYVMSEVQSCGPCTQTDDQVIVVVRSLV